MLKEMLRRHEGCRLAVYDDATGEPIGSGSTLVGQPTIGYGRNLAGRGIDPVEAGTMLDADIDRVLTECQTLGWWAGLDAARQAAIADMVFQLGLPRFKDFTKTIAALQARDYPAAAAHILDSAYARQVPARAAEIARMIEAGGQPAQPVTVPPQPFSWRRVARWLRG